jgi:hypothetical protein
MPAPLQGRRQRPGRHKPSNHREYCGGGTQQTAMLRPLDRRFGQWMLHHPVRCFTAVIADKLGLPVSCAMPFTDPSDRFVGEAEVIYMNTHPEMDVSVS